MPVARKKKRDKTFWLCYYNYVCSPKLVFQTATTSLNMAGHPSTVHIKYLCGASTKVFDVPKQSCDKSFSSCGIMISMGVISLLIGLILPYIQYINEYHSPKDPGRFVLEIDDWREYVDFNDKRIFLSQ